MSALELFIQSAGITDCQAMDCLQDQGGIISDCCTWPCDVADSDCPAAIAFLRAKFPTPETQEVLAL